MFFEDSKGDVFYKKAKACGLRFNKNYELVWHMKMDEELPQ